MTITDTTEPLATEPLTAAQKVVQAMWTRLDQPATAAEIAEKAGVGYSTVTPILRKLRQDGKATKDDSGLWALVLDDATPPADTEDPDTGDDDATDTEADDTDASDLDAGGDTTSEPDPQDTDAPTAAQIEQATVDTGELPGSPAAEPQPDAATPDDSGTAAEAAGGPDDGSDAAPGQATPDVPTDGDPAPEAPADQQGTRPYRKPAQPRRAKGALRAQVLAVLTAAPEQEFKVLQICKAIDAATPDGSANKAGPGAVANALDKLVISGDAVRVETATVATYQAARAGA